MRTADTVVVKPLEPDPPGEYSRLGGAWLVLDCATGEFTVEYEWRGFGTAEYGHPQFGTHLLWGLRYYDIAEANELLDARKDAAQEILDGSFLDIDEHGRRYAVVWTAPAKRARDKMMWPRDTWGD